MFVRLGQEITRSGAGNDEEWAGVCASLFSNIIQQPPALPPLAPLQAGGWGTE